MSNEIAYWRAVARERELDVQKELRDRVAASLSGASHAAILCFASTSLVWVDIQQTTNEFVPFLVELDKEMHPVDAIQAELRARLGQPATILLPSVRHLHSARSSTPVVCVYVPLETVPDPPRDIGLASLRADLVPTGVRFCGHSIPPRGLIPLDEVHCIEEELKRSGYSLIATWWEWEGEPVVVLAPERVAPRGQRRASSARPIKEMFAGPMKAWWRKILDIRHEHFGRSVANDPIKYLPPFPLHFGRDNPAIFMLDGPGHGSLSKSLIWHCPLLALSTHPLGKGPEELSWEEQRNLFKSRSFTQVDADSLTAAQRAALLSVHNRSDFHRALEGFKGHVKPEASIQGLLDGGGEFTLREVYTLSWAGTPLRVLQVLARFLGKGLVVRKVVEKPGDSPTARAVYCSTRRAKPSPNHRRWSADTNQDAVAWLLEDHLVAFPDGLRTAELAEPSLRGWWPNLARGHHDGERRELSKLLSQLAKQGRLVKSGRGPGTRYALPNSGALHR